ncbi:bifunctional 3-(3-hydroxy-phenyl)propionate/3-hydroxycinnamic acid hydroxylase [Nocardioides immobilis]|uniref:bifunctional 3-(3-hydroxy-phenyl)propionate/3-hydroxycinnamic acid hydroxylase MhpA n=1 Tax=Nocardioides immobilis TaxID=2049295 RepID=UPI001C716D49|nr:bifunctional 3-(3-hydroxy-phenyl)propionate/3-hydroxycinnamic acid hydroxylase [Nocardioides immobilis]
MSSSSNVLPVVVVGAGPSGVTAATLLAQYGVEVLVLDRWASVYPQPRAVHLDDEIYRIVARLGLADEFARISRPSQGLRLMDPEHRVLAEFRRDGGAGRHGFPQANMFDQPELEALLRANLCAQPSVTFRGDVLVTAVHQSAAGPVRVDLTDRTTGETEAIEATYVLGCDGANSVVRRSIGATMQDLRFEQRWLVVDVNTDHDLGQWEGVHQVCDTDRAATYMRISERRYRWEFQLKDGETSQDFEDIAVLDPLLRPWTGAVPVADLELVRVAEYTFRAQLADRWRDRNVFLLGDAAHLTPPFIGQGMGAGLRDAANLAWKLAGVLQGHLAPVVLDTYEQERRPHTAQMIRLAIVVGTAMTRGGRTGDLLRRLVAPRLHLVPGFRARVLDSTTPPCARARSSPVVADAGGWPARSARTRRSTAGGSTT